MDEQNRYIKEGHVDYVVLRLESSDELISLDVPFLYDNYELTATEDQLFGETSFVYLLFKHK